MNNNAFYKETERLILRSPREGDAEALARARSTEFVMRYNLYRPCGAAEIIAELDTYEHIILTQKGSDTIIGCVSVRDDDFRYHMDSVALHAWLTEEYAHKGYMKEALDVMIKEVFCVRLHERIAIQILSENRASIRLAEKLGFEREGYLKRALKNAGGEVFDVVLYSLDRETYLKK